MGFSFIFANLFGVFVAKMTTMRFPLLNLAPHGIESPVESPVIKLSNFVDHYLCPVGTVTILNSTFSHGAKTGTMGKICSPNAGVHIKEFNLTGDTCTIFFPYIFGIHADDGPGLPRKVLFNISNSKFYKFAGRIAMNLNTNIAKHCQTAYEYCVLLAQMGL